MTKEEFEIIHDLKNQIESLKKEIKDLKRTEQHNHYHTHYHSESYTKYNDPLYPRWTDVWYGTGYLGSGITGNLNNGLISDPVGPIDYEAKTQNYTALEKKAEQECLTKQKI